MMAGYPSNDELDPPLERTAGSGQGAGRHADDSQAHRTTGVGGSHDGAAGATSGQLDGPEGVGGSLEMASDAGGSHHSREIFSGFSAGKRGCDSGPSEVGGGGSGSDSVAVFMRRYSVEEAFATWEGRLMLDRIFGDGFGTNPGGAFAEGEMIPVDVVVRARVAASIDDRAADREISELLGESGGGFRELQVDGRRATAREFLTRLRTPRASREWESAQGRCCA